MRNMCDKKYCFLYSKILCNLSWLAQTHDAKCNLIMKKRTSDRTAKERKVPLCTLVTCGVDRLALWLFSITIITFLNRFIIPKFKSTASCLISLHGSQNQVIKTANPFISFNFLTK